MKSLFRVAAQLDDLLAERGWRYCFIGGIALQRWGQPRLTNDIDLTILAESDRESYYVDELLGLYNARLPDAREFAQEFFLELDNSILYNYEQLTASRLKGR